MSVLSVVIAALLSASAPTEAGQPTTPPASSAANPDNKKICRTLKVTGSRLGQRRVCGTKRQWDLMTQETQDKVHGLQNQSKRPRDIATR